jgi:hypothetical protein
MVQVFNFGVATNTTEPALSVNDAVVKLVGVPGLHAADAAGVVTLHV